MRLSLLILIVIIAVIYLYVKMLSAPIVIAHRGASFLAPEETRPAFQLALEMGADYIEIDVQRTLDGVLIAIHDDTFKRTTNIEEIFPERANDPVGSFTWEEVQKLDAGSWFNQKYPERAKSSYAGLKILSLEEIIDLVGESGRLYIESKNPDRYPGYEKEMIDLLNRKGKLKKDQVIFESFDLESLKRFRAIAPEIPRVWLLENIPFHEAIAKAKGVVQGVGPTAEKSFPWQVITAHRAGLFVHTWTIDWIWQMWLMKAFGVDGIFTNRPETALSLYGKKATL